MSNHEGEIFAVAAGCMDGRVHGPVADYARKKAGAEYVDTVTEAGFVKNFNEENQHTPESQAISKSARFKIFDVSVGKHGSKMIIVHGHQECAGNPVDDELHKKDVLSAAKAIKEMGDGSVEVIPVFVVRDEPEWRVEPL